MSKDTAELAHILWAMSQHSVSIEDATNALDEELQAFRDAIEAPLLEQIAMLRCALYEISTFPRRRFPAEIAKEALSETASSDAWLKQRDNKVCNEELTELLAELKGSPELLDSMDGGRAVSMILGFIRARIENRKGEE